MNRTWIYHHRWDLAAAVVVLLSYALVLSVTPRHVFWSPDEGGKFLYVRSVRWQDGFTYQIPYAGRPLDPEFEFFLSERTYPRPSVTPSGTLHLRFAAPIWFSLISLPGLAAFGITGLYLLPLLSGWLIALVSGLLARTFNPRLAPVAILVVGLATPVFFYSLTFWEHTPATLCALVAVWILVTAQPGRLRTLVAIAPPLLLAMMLRIEMISVAAASFLTWGLCGLVVRWRPVQRLEAKRIWAVPQWPRALRLVIYLGLAGVLMYLLVNSITLRHTYLIQSLPKGIVAYLNALPYAWNSVSAVLVSGDVGAGPHVGYAWTMIAAIGLCFLAPLLTRVRAEAVVIIPALLVMLALSASLALLGQGYRSLHGLFPIAPFMVVWPYVVPYAWRVRNYSLLTLATLALLYLSIGCAAILYTYGTPRGLRVGLEWGQRYSLALYPILAVLSLVALQIYRESARPGWLKAAFAILVSVMVMIGLQFEVRGLATMRADRQKLADWERVLRTEGPIITDIWWLPAALAPLFEKHQMFFVDQRGDVARWVGLATQHNVASFTFASMWPAKEGEFGGAAIRHVPEHSRFVSGLYLTRFDIPANAVSASAGRQQNQPGRHKRLEDR